MMLIKSLNEENCDIKKISIHSVKGEKYNWHVEKHAQICWLDRSEVVKSNQKYKACKDKRKMDGRE